MKLLGFFSALGVMPIVHLTCAETTGGGGRPSAVGAGTTRFADEDANDVDAAGVRTIAPAGKHVGRVATEPRRRMDQSRTLIDVLVLYSDRALTDFDFSENGLVDRIYEAFEETNDAMDKSEIALDINVVHVQKLPYAQESTDALDEAHLFMDNTDVKHLRNKHSADLVMMVGSVELGGQGGQFNGNADVGVSVIDARRVFDGSRGHTHEIGHNLGADHNFLDALDDGISNNHGRRYCNSDDGYVTVMAYTDSKNCNVEVANYFSNPAVAYNHKATGNDRCNNAQVIKENMGRVSKFRCRNNGGACTDDRQCCGSVCLEGTCMAQNINIGGWTRSLQNREEPGHYAEPGDYVELGCAADPTSGQSDGRLMSEGPVLDGGMSAELCFGICQEKSPAFKYFGTQWGNECFCSMTLPDDLSFDPEHSGCNSTCAGSADGEICGGYEAITVYSVTQME